MTFDEILGYTTIKKFLKQTISKDRIAHAQLFIGEQGTGVLSMAIAYATEILVSKGNETTLNKCRQLIHPDMHFAFPTTINSKVKKDPISKLFLQEWRSFVKEQPYGTLYDWYQCIEVENKQGVIGVAEARDISNKLILQPFEGGYKIMIIWGADLMNTECANKLLKLLEEPPSQTIFILVAQNEENMLQTIVSRCQITRFPNLSESQIKQELIDKKGLDLNKATSIAIRSQGNFKKALDYLQEIPTERKFEQWFIQWVRTAYSAKGNKSSVLELIKWSESISNSGRETQKRFIEYCLQVFRQSILWNYSAEDLVYIEFENTSFQIERFARFVHHANIIDIQKELEKALYHIERNGNAKMILTDLSIKITRLLHTPK